MTERAEAEISILITSAILRLCARRFIQRGKTCFLLLLSLIGTHFGPFVFTLGRAQESRKAWQ